MSKWIKSGDQVIVTAGNEKGKTGNVISRGKDRVLIEGVNMRRKHMKRTQESQPAQIVDMEAPLHISNVSLCSKEGKPIKVKVKFSKNNEKQLVYRDGDKETVFRSVKKQAG